MIETGAAERQGYKPGDRVPRSGIYRVVHGAHRLLHETTLLRDTVFPFCKKCKGETTFVMVRPVKDSRVLPFRSTEFLQEYPELKSRAG